ncbi:MAG: undecaprenyl-diphosphate phosphatase [Planctomycetota bacterium]
MTERGEALLLAVIQGLTEFLPISSSGHLEAWKRISGSELQGDLSLDVLLHLATLFAVLLVYRRDVARLIGALLGGGESRRELLLVLLGAVPAGVFGLLLRSRIEGLFLAAPWVLPVAWAGCGLALLTIPLALRRRSAPRPIGVGAALWIGAWQVVALLPGVSRSGITIVAALWAGVEREEAARYSFLIAAPLVAGAALLEVPDLLRGGEAGSGAGALLPAFLLAFLIGWVALKLLLRLLRTGRLHLWGYYLLAAAVGLIAFGL